MPANPMIRLTYVVFAASAALVPFTPAVAGANADLTTRVTAQAVKSDEKPPLVAGRGCHGHRWCGGGWRHWNHWRPWHRGCHHRCHGRTGPQGPQGPQGPAGPAGTAGSSVDTAFHGNRKFVAQAPGDGRTLVRDPRTTPTWHDLSSIDNYPGGVTGVSLANRLGRLHVTVRTASGQVFQTECRLNPTPGTGMNDPWPGNCSDFIDLTPPN
ncbi:hypothetical protein HII36_13185 [Nonomuraea sp. NN258]|uniref:hypothetical protein n=1 Tax=Nonomuraea antri TaxID=2730852 RepID=UPI001568ACBF|nr:hypothetical protein [Nonomuraea antri]NRQ32786.1 hypothetical protein [Nonomuraea antri]